MRHILDCGAEYIGWVLDISTALKNGSGQPGTFSAVFSVALS
jgi:hypothetical protein